MPGHFRDLFYLSILFIQVKKHHKGRFFDKLRIFARGGAGGQGYARYGGLGGRGGHVVVRAEKNVTFENLVSVNPTKRYTAASGGNSR